MDCLRRPDEEQETRAACFRKLPLELGRLNRNVLTEGSRSQASEVSVLGLKTGALLSLGGEGISMLLSTLSKAASSPTPLEDAESSPLIIRVQTCDCLRAHR